MCPVIGQFISVLGTGPGTGKVCVESENATHSFKKHMLTPLPPGPVVPARDAERPAQHYGEGLHTRWCHLSGALIAGQVKEGGRGILSRGNSNTEPSRPWPARDDRDAEGTWEQRQRRPVVKCHPDPFLAAWCHLGQSLPSGKLSPFLHCMKTERVGRKPQGHR